MKFFAILALFYILVTLMLYSLVLFKYLQTSLSITLFAAIVGPSVPSFLAIYLSRYSEQASASRKQELLFDISTRKEISEARQKHYDELSTKAEEIIRFLPPSKQRNVDPSEYLKNPLLGEQFQICDIKALKEDESMKEHLERFKSKVDSFSFQKLIDLLEDNKKLNGDYEEFKTEISNELRVLTLSNNSITVSPVAQNINGKTDIGEDNLQRILLYLWKELYNNISESEEQFKNSHFPEKPSLSYLKNESTEYWNISTPNLTFKNILIIAIADNLSANYEVIEIVKNLTFNPQLRSSFITLYKRRKFIDEYIEDVKKMIKELKDKISKKPLKSLRTVELKKII